MYQEAVANKTPEACVDDDERVYSTAVARTTEKDLGLNILNLKVAVIADPRGREHFSVLPAFFFPLVPSSPTLAIT